ncbi:uncharacterized protein LOC144701419 [Wolffia australiana]
MDVYINSKFLEGNLDYNTLAQEALDDTEPSPAGNKNLLTPEDLRIALSELQVEDFPYHGHSDYHEGALQLGITLNNQLIKIQTNLGDDRSPLELKGSTSLPAAPLLVSAMKGGREKAGSPRMKMQVKWADDVYDPPTSSMSHTVKNSSSYSKQRSKAKKESQKQKQKKKKKKPARERQLLSNRMLMSESGSSTAISWQEAKCGSSVTAGELEKLRFTVAEAT